MSIYSIVSVRRFVLISLLRKWCQSKIRQQTTQAWIWNILYLLHNWLHLNFGPPPDCSTAERQWVKCCFLKRSVYLVLKYFIYYKIHAHVWPLRWRQAHSVLMWLCLSRHFILSSGQCEHMFSRLLSCSNAAAAAPIDQGMDLKWCLKKDLEFHSKLGACDWDPLGL